MLCLVPKRKAKFPFLNLFFSIKVCYGEIYSGIHAAARRRRRRSKFRNPDRGQKSARSRGSVGGSPCACASEERASDEETARACVHAYVRACVRARYCAVFFLGSRPNPRCCRDSPLTQPPDWSKLGHKSRQRSSCVA
jgi:hypothetical protein